MTIKEKEKKNVFELSDILKIIQEEFGEGTVTTLSKDNFKMKKEAISSGSLSLDNIMWTAQEGGFVRGKIYEISGLQSSGKSTLAFHVVRECQKLGEKVVYFDLENGIDAEYMKNIGVDLKELIITYPFGGEEAFDMMSKFIDLGVSLIVVDSVSNLVPRSQLESSAEKNRIGSHAALMSSGLRKIKSKLINKKTIIVFINQLRNNINTSFYGPNGEVTTGGMALPYEADLRIRLKSREKLEKEKKLVGIRVEAKIIKNRFFKPFGVAELDFFFSKGLDKVKELTNLALKRGIIQRNSSYYTFEEKRLGQGLESLLSFLEKKENSVVLNEVKRKVIESFSLEEE